MESAMTGNIDPQLIRNFLIENPDFLVQNPDLLDHLTPPGNNMSGGGVVDFQQRMLERLKDQNNKSRDTQRQIIAASRENMNSQSRVHAAVLHLLEARSFEELLEIVISDLAIIVDADMINVLIENTEDQPMLITQSGVRIVPEGVIDEILGDQEAILRANIDGHETLHGEGSGLVKSEALLLLEIGDEGPVGLLSFGSREPERFHEDQGTELICFLAQVVERCMRQWLENGE